MSRISPTIRRCAMGISKGFEPRSAFKRKRPPKHVGPTPSEPTSISHGDDYSGHRDGNVYVLRRVDRGEQKRFSVRDETYHCSARRTVTGGGRSK